MQRSALGIRIAIVFALLGMGLVVTACGDSAGERASSPTPAEQPAPQEPAPAEPEYTSWVVSIVDDDSFSQGDVTYEIALNLQATNAAGDIAGTYKGEATAKTSTSGVINGQPLQADAIAQSGPLEFTLASGEGDLAALTTDTVVYGGSGSITMAAAGSGTIGAAGGGFSNTSSQQFTMTVIGDAITMKIPIQGHTYTFTGTISGR